MLHLAKLHTTQRFDAMRGDPEISTRSNLTLSVNNDLLQDLKNESQKLGTSINLTVNNILSDHVMFGKYLSQHHPIIIAQELFKFLLDGLSDEKIHHAWIMVLSQITPQIFAMHNIENTLENYLKYAINDLGFRVGAWNSSSIKESEGDLYLIIKHNYGLKWSQAIAFAHIEFIKQTFQKTINAESFADMIKIKIPNYSIEMKT